MQCNQALLKINLAALQANFRALRNKISPKTALAAAIKANAYGLGIAEVARVFHRENGRDFFVATLEEGIAAREILTDSAIYVLAGFDAGICEHYRLTPVLNSLADIERFRKSGDALPCALHFDTGINRLGIGRDETEKLLADPALLKNLNIKLVMSHFACADEKDHPLTRAQYETFMKIAAHFPGTKKSLSNSSGIFRSAEYHCDMVRPGMALYGLNPTPKSKNPMRPVMTLEAPVLQVRHCRTGETVGYGASYKLERASALATIGAGYADGLPRALSGKGRFYWKNHPCPLTGRISMDVCVIDITDIPDREKPAPGDMVEIIGPHQSADDLAAAAGTIGYEILTSLGSRYKRLYI